MKKFLFLISLIACMSSCGNDDLESVEAVIPNQAQQLSFKISPEEAKIELSNFMNQFNSSNTRTRSVEEMQIADVCPIRNGVHTRAAASNMSDSYDVDIDTLLYAKNFADNQGFALVAADKRTSPILAIIDEGSFSIDSLNENKDEGFLMFVDYAIKMEIQDIENYKKPSQTRSLKTNGYTINSEYTPISMIHLTNNQVKLQTINITLNIQS